MRAEIASNDELKFIGTPEEMKALSEFFSNNVVSCGYESMYDIEIQYEEEAEITRKSIDEKMKEVSEWVVSTFRPLFKGIKRGAMGDRNRCIHNLAVFLLGYQEYSKEDIIEAAKSYIERHSVNPIHMRRADYFVFKQLTQDGKRVIISDLLSELEEDSEGFINVDMFDSIN